MRALFLLCAVFTAAFALGTRASAAPRAPARSRQTIPLTLFPAAGPPGTVVQATGQISDVDTAAPADAASAHAIVCWDNCPNGPTADVDVQWSSDQPGEFTLQFTVPSAAWLTPGGPHALTPGDYSVGALCLTPPGRLLVSGCAVGAPQANGSFTLTGPIPAGCATADCATIALQPAAAAPGDLVTLTGRAPVVSLTPGPVFSLQLSLTPAGGGPAATIVGLMLNQAAAGTLEGSFRLPFTEDPLGPLTPELYTATLTGRLFPANSSSQLAATSFTVLGAPPFASVAPAPVRIDRSTPLNGAALTSEPLNPNRLAYCAPGSIQASIDGGITWTTVPTDGAGAAADPGLPLFSGGHDAVACVYAVPAPGLPNAYFAVFQAQQPEGAPPIFFEPFETLDGGTSWQLLPLPDGYSVRGFGGLQVVNGAVEALFEPDLDSRASSRPAVEQAQAGGSWAPQPFDCPAEDACVRWGAAPSAIGSCAMNERVQPVLYSTDGGATFQSPDWPKAANACSLNEIVSLASGDILLLSGEDNYPARVSHDGGATWSALALPLLPGADPSGPQRYPGLQMLPDGTLLAQADAGWVALPPGAPAWCAAAAIPQTADLQSVRPIADRLWWIDVSNPQNAVPGSAPLATITAGC